MNYYKHYHRIVFITIAFTSFFFTFSIKAQQSIADTVKLSVPGPANQDVSKFASFYVVRPYSDIDADRWQGFFIEKNIMAKVDNNSKYIITCGRMGKTEVWCGNEKRSSINIDIEPGKKYYVRMDILPGAKYGYPTITLLDNEAGIKAFNSVAKNSMQIFDPDPLEFHFLFQNIKSSYVWDLNEMTGFNEFMFNPPVSTRHCFASADLGFIFGYVNKMVSSTFSEEDIIQRMSNIDFDSEEDFEKYVKKNIDKAAKKLKKSETLKEKVYEKISTPADMSYAAYSVTQDTRPEGVSLNGREFVEVRTWQACLYKKEIKGAKGRTFLVTFSERGLPEELHNKEEIFYKINLLLQSGKFGKV